jgi:hypothetical protein
MIEIQIGNRNVSQVEILENPAQFKEILEDARANHLAVTCLCATPAPKLVVRRVTSGYILARWPRTGLAHNKDTCRFQTTELGGSASRVGDLRSAFDSTDDGLSIKLNISIAVRNEQISPRGDPGVGADGRVASTSRASAGLLAMLEYLWEQSSLHKWLGDGKSRSWATCYSMLISTVGEGRINGVSMGKVLHVVEPFFMDRKGDINKAIESFFGGLGDDGQVDMRGIVIGEIKEINETRSGGFRVILKNSSIGTIFMSKEVHDNAQKSFKSAMNSIADDDRRTVVAMCIRLQKSGFADVLSFAAMLTNRSFIPCDSSYEIQMADRLIRERRRFTKPLRHLDNEPVHPDFVLDDVTSPTVIEVWGMAGQENYETRKQEKLAHYNSAAIKCVGWSPEDTSVASVALPSPATSR